MRHMLAFIVAGAAAVEEFAFDARLEGGCFPQIERLGRLHIVMSVDHEVRPTFAARRAREHDRVALRWDDLGSESRLARFAGDPIRRALHVRAMLLLRRHAWDADVIDEFLDETIFVFPKITEHLFHEGKESTISWVGAASGSILRNSLWSEASGASHSQPNAF